MHEKALRLCRPRLAQKTAKISFKKLTLIIVKRINISDNLLLSKEQLIHLNPLFKNSESDYYEC